MSTENGPNSYRCTVAVTLEVIGGKWKSLILWHLSFKTLRFSQLQRRLGKVTQKMLTQQLRELESNGLIHRHVYAEVPPRVEYSLTDLGRSTLPILELMCQWGKDYLGQDSCCSIPATANAPEENEKTIITGLTNSAAQL